MHTGERKTVGENSKFTVKVIPAIVDRAEYSENRPKKRTCAYCRVSTGDEDQKLSYELQVTYYTGLIMKNEEWEYGGIYADRGISGTSIKNRTEFKRMIEDCKAGKIDMIITKSISRFARNTLDCLNYIRLLKGLPSPVGIYFEKENIDTLDSKSELILTILSSLAQEEARNISENLQWSIQKRCQQGKAHCPTAFFMGYDKDENGELIINEPQAVIVRRIYQEYLEGYGAQAIANRLTQEGIKTARGNTKWYDSSVLQILRNEKYVGDILMQKRITVDFLTHKRVPNRGEQPQYFIENHHPAIVSRDVWTAVQKELERRASLRIRTKGDKRQRRSDKSCFSNILYCGTCGEPFVRRYFASTKKNEKYSYPAWKCRTADGRVKDKECHARSYREDSIRQSFMGMLIEMKQEMPSFIVEVEDAIHCCELDDWEKDRLEYLEMEIESLSGHLRNLATSSSDNSVRDVYENRSFELAQEIEMRRKELQQLKKKKNEAAELQKLLAWLIKELKEIEEFDMKKEIIPFREDIFKRIVQKGYVFDDASISYELAFGITKKAFGNDFAVWKLAN